jgi:hypothetical protein
MRCLEILALSAGGLLLASCGDEGGGPSVSPKVNWVIGCKTGQCGSGRAYHDQMLTKKKFAVTCRKVNIAGRSDIEFTITDPGEADDPATSMSEERSSSTISVQNGNAEMRKCDVLVREPPFAGAANLTYVGQCAGSNAMGVCTISGAFDQNGFDWVGQLSCDGFSVQNSTTATYTLGSSATPGAPVTIELDNCD